MNDSERMKIKDAFLNFLVDSEIDCDLGPDERGAVWVSNSKYGLQLEQLAKVVGFHNMKDAMIVAELWDEDPPPYEA